MRVSTEVQRRRTNVHASGTKASCNRGWNFSWLCRLPPFRFVLRNPYLASSGENVRLGVLATWAEITWVDDVRRATLPIAVPFDVKPLAWWKVQYFSKSVGCSWSETGDALLSELWSLASWM